MTNDIKNLTSSEKSIVLKLQNSHHKVKLYLDELQKLVDNFDLGDLDKKADWYKTIFEYYNDDLIPAIQESAEMEMKHIKIFERNPDQVFQPTMEIINHQHLSRQFFLRFEHIYNSFENFKKEVQLYSK